MSKYCSNCGAEQNDGGRFCSNCGNQLNGVVTYNNNNNGTYAYTNGAAIAGFICSFFFTIIGLILSIIGISEANKHDGTGKGLAIAGLIISLLRLLSIVFLIIVPLIVGSAYYY